MRIVTGCDLIGIDRFKSAEMVPEKVFTPHELSQGQSLESLAGMFAAKEAVIKALDLPHGSWQMIEIIKEESGKPVCKLVETNSAILSSDISIAHDGGYAFATAVFLLEA